MHRNLGVFTTRGVDLARLFRQLFGQGRRLHQGPRPHVPLRRARAAHRRHDQPPRRDAAGGRRSGPGRAAQRRGAAWRPPSPATARTSEGDFHEAVNLAAVWKLPVLFVIENNQYGLSTPVARAVRLRRPRRPRRRLRHARRRRGRQRPAGRASRRCARRPSARGAATGPTLLEFKTFRMRGHEEASGTAYVPQGAVRGVGDEGSGRALRAALLDERGILTAARARRAARGAQGAHRRAGGRGARRAATRLHAGDASWRTSTRRRRARPAPPAPRSARPPRPRRGYVDAISDGLREAMRARRRASS